MRIWQFFTFGALLLLCLTAAAQPADTTGIAKGAKNPATSPAVVQVQPADSDSTVEYLPETNYDEDYDYYYWEYNDNWSGYDPSDDYDSQHGRDAREDRDDRDQGSRGE